MSSDQLDSENLEKPVMATVNAMSPALFSGKLPKIIPFQELCRCGDEVWIECDRQVYRLRRTKQGKLILTK